MIFYIIEPKDDRNIFQLINTTNKHIINIFKVYYAKYNII